MNLNHLNPAPTELSNSGLSEHPIPRPLPTISPSEQSTAKEPTPTTVAPLKTAGTLPNATPSVPKPTNTLAPTTQTTVTAPAQDRLQPTMQALPVPAVDGHVLGDG